MHRQIVNKSMPLPHRVAIRVSPRLLPAIGALAAIALQLEGCVIDLDHLSDGQHPGGDAAVDAPVDSADGADGADAMDASEAADDVVEADAWEDVPAEGGCPVLECGKCGGNTLVTTPFVKDPGAVVVTGTELLWANTGDNTLMRLSSMGGDPVVLATGTGLGSIAAAGPKVVWAESDGLYACTQAGCARQKIADALQTGSIRQIAYYGMRVYWTDINTGAADGKVRSCLVDYCGSSLKDEAIEDIRPYGIVVNSSKLFWTMQGSEPGDSGFIYTCDKTACNETQLTDPVFRPTFITATESNAVYWTERPIGDLARAFGCDYASAQPCAKFEVAPGAQSIDANDIAVSLDRVYWTNPGPDTLSSCPLGGCKPPEQPEEHATGRTDIRRLALNESCVFWTDNVNGGSIGKAPK